MLAFYLSMAVLSAVEALPLNSRAIVVRNPGIWPDASSTDYLVSSIPRKQEIF